MHHSEKTENDQDDTAESQLIFRAPVKEDGPAIWRLVVDSGVLDKNSLYTYLLLCEHFSQTCVLTECDGEIVGFVTGYILPDRDDTVFVWQIAVDANHRGKRLASRLLDKLLERTINQKVRYLETTVSPSNLPSDRLFRKLAQRWNAELILRGGFPESLFPYDAHEAEPLYRIGPITQP